MKNSFLIIVVFFSLLITSCTTYHTFYSPTYREAIPTKKIYRVDLSPQEGVVPNIDLSSLKDLKTLRLSNRSDINIDSILRVLPRPEKLEVLILDSLQLKVLPTGILQLKNLHHLSLNHNPNLNFEESFSMFSELPIHFLNLQFNDLTEIPKGISSIKSIRDLNISHNQLSSFTDLTSLSQLPQLYSLWIQHNNLTELPTSIGKLVQINKLYIEHNQLTDFPEEIVQLKKLIVLHVGHNHFEELPVILTKMNFLFLLHISNCRIATIPDAYIGGDFKIKGLIMPNNYLSEKDRIFWNKEFNNFFALAL